MNNFYDVRDIISSVLHARGTEYGWDMCEDQSNEIAKEIIRVLNQTGVADI